MHTQEAKIRALTVCLKCIYPKLNALQATVIVKADNTRSNHENPVFKLIPNLADKKHNIAQ